MTLMIAVLFLAAPPNKTWAQSEALPDGISADIAGVISAITLRLQGEGYEENTAPVYFVGDALTPMPDEGLYKGFVISNVMIESYQPWNLNQNVQELRAYLGLQDPFGRFATISLSTLYTNVNGEIHVQVLNSELVSLPFPKAEFFAVPSQKVSADLFLNSPNSGVLIANLFDIALPLGEPKNLPSAVGDYTIIALMRHRLPDSAKVILGASSSLQDGQEVNLGASEVNLDGWRLLSIRTQFDFKSGPEAFFKVIYQPGIQPDGHQPEARVVAVMSTHPTLPNPRAKN